MGKDSIVDSVAGDTICQQEIFVRYGGAIFETHDGALFVNLLHFGVVRLGVNANDRHTSIQIDFERDIVTGTHSVGRAGGRNTGGICWLICTGGNLLLRLRGRDVAWGDNHREGPLVRTIFVLQRLNVANDDANAFTRQDVRNLLREDVRSLLIEQACDFPNLFSGGVGLLGLFTAHDLSFNCAITDQHREIVNSGGLREWKGVNRLDLVLGVVLEVLSDSDTRQEATDLGLHFGVLQRTLGALTILIDVLKSAPSHDASLGSESFVVHDR